MSGGFPITLVAAGGAPFTPVSRGAPLATVSTAGVPVTLVSSGGAPLIVDGWTPADLGASLLGQLDAENFASLTLSTGLVDAWADTVAAVSFTATLTVRPAYSATSFNGRPGVTFDGSNDCLTLASVPYPAAAGPCEIWSVVDQTALVADTGQRVIMSWGDVPNVRRSSGRAVSSGVNRARSGAGTGAAVVTADNATADFSGVHVVRSIFTGTAAQTDVDGVAGTPAAVVPATGTTRSRIGAFPAAAPLSFWQGVINCIFVTAPLTNVQATTLRAYLARRGGI